MHSEFEVHKLNERGINAAQGIADVFDWTLSQLEGLCSADPFGRHMFVVRSKLEEACFFAKKAMAVNPDNQE